MTETINCNNPASRLIAETFMYNPHILGVHIIERLDEEGGYIGEDVVVGFTHYADIFNVIFDPDTKVGIVELMIQDEESIPEGGGSMVEYGVITVEKLLELLGKLPHIDSFLEDELPQGEVFH